MPDPVAGPNRLGFRGYTTHQEFNGIRLPVPVQNLVMRDYSNRNGLMYLLSVNELDFPSCYLQLQKVLNQLPDLEGVLMCSPFMLPKDPDERWSIYSQFINNGASLHFAMDNTAIRDAQGVERIEEIIQISQTLQSSPVSISHQLLPHLSGMESFTFND